MPKAAPKQKRKEAPTPRRQVAALPYRVNAFGVVEILIVTSRETGRFIIPKGWPMKGLADTKSAATEAFEEAGVIGKARNKPIGAYTYWKRFQSSFELVSVDVYPIEVQKSQDVWPEMGQRKMAWLPAKDAALLIDEPALADLIKKFKI